MLPTEVAWLGAAVPSVGLPGCLLCALGAVLSRGVQPEPRTNSVIIFEKNLILVGEEKQVEGPQHGIAT